MNNEIVTRRGLIITLVIATVVIFVGLVWLIATFRPWNWFASVQSTPTAGSLAIRDCTYPISYWRAHPELYPDQIVIGGMIYREFELEALLIDDTQDPLQQLKAQMAVAFLNGQAGADQSSIERILFDSYGWLVRHPVGSPMTDKELEQGRQLFDSLEAYNLGLASVSPCEAGLVSTRMFVPSVTLTSNTILTSTQTTSPTALETSPIAGITATDTIVYVVPIDTATRTPKPPVQLPTDTPAQPTAPPPATDTQRPPDTATFTPPPPSPSPTFPPPTPTLPLPSPTLP